MSASTVSITANTAARRRSVVVGEKQSNNIELSPAEPQVNGAGGGEHAIGGGTGVDKVTAAHSRDLSHHSIRGEAVLVRTSKDLVQLKKAALHNSTASPRRTRRTVPKPEKPRWLTVVSIFTKNFALLLVLIGLAQLVRMLVLKPGDSPAGATEIGFSEFEGRIAEVESFLKTTAKLIQVQVEAVDKKIDQEVGGLRRELSKKIDDRASILESGLKELEVRNEVLKNSIGEIKAVDWLSKEEFEKFYEELKKGKGGERGASDVTLDAVKAYAREMVEKEIEKHAADGLARVDYALASGGAMVLKHAEPFVPKEATWFSINPLGRMSARRRIHPDALNMLKPSFGEPGQCFPLKGSSGFVQISLRTAIIPEAITLEHVAKSVAYDRSSAPKDCRVSGWLQGHNFDLAVDAEKMFILREFTYDLEKSNAQTFDVLDPAASGLIDTVRLDFTSNHGSSTHTCIYRLRVHGYEPDSLSVIKMES